MSQWPWARLERRAVCAERCPYGSGRRSAYALLTPFQITVFNSRTAEQKKALFRRIAALLGESPGIRPEDVFVNILDAPKENWSVGHGVAQFA